MTRALGVDSCFRASSDFCALTVCTVPKIEFIVMTARMTIVLSSSPEIMLMMAATIRIRTSRSLNCERKIMKG